MQRLLSRSVRNIEFVVFMLVMGIAAQNLTARAESVQDRITQPIVAGKISAVQGTLHPLARAEYDQGPVAGSMAIHGMSLDFKPSATQQASLAALLKAQQDPSSPSYRKWLTSDQFGQQFGMSQSDLTKVKNWLQAQGFTIDHVAESQTSIRFSGTAALTEAAFHTQIHRYVVKGETHFANASAVSLPSTFAATVVQVGGLHDFRLKPRFVKRPRFTSGSNAPDAGAHYLTPGDFAVIYDVNPLYTGNYTGKGQTIGIIGQTDIVLADITSFRSNSNLTVNNPTIFVVPSTTPGNDFTTGDINEADLDLEWSGGVAPDASIVFVNSNDVIVSLQYAIENKINGLQIPILSISYGGCEQQEDTAYIQGLETTLQQANAQGQTVVGVAGDNGAADCDYTTDPNNPVTTAVNGYAVDYPGSSAYVTNLGGAEFVADGSAEDPPPASDQYWSSGGNTDQLVSALSYIPEGIWNDSAFLINNGYGGIAAGGGGASLLFSKPAWQTGVAGIPSDGVRDVPDIALNASPNHDGYLVCTQIVPSSDSNTDLTNADFVSSCQSGFRTPDPGYADDQYPAVYGGTSAAAPSFAGLLALIEQKLGASQGLGNINPTLYTLAASSSTYASAFHDITTGDNMVPCSPGTPAGSPTAQQCPSSGELGFSAATGYDQASGLGSVDANNLATAFSTTATKTGTTTTLGFSPSSPAVEAAVTLTATVAPNTGSVVPTGSVSFTVDGTFFSTVPLTAGVATATTTFAAGGAHTVIAAYSGDSTNYASTSATTTIPVTGGTSMTTTTVALTPSSTIPVGGSLVITATINAPAGGALAGTVNFYANSTSGTALNGTTQVAVVPGANGVATATYTVTSVQTSQGFTIGSNTVIAVYGGSATFASSTGNAPITVTNPSITLAVANMTISSASAGNTGTSAITLTSTGGYAGTVNLTATAPSLDASYSITPEAVVLVSGGTGTSSISIETIAADILKGRAKFHKAQTSNRVVATAAVAFGCIFLLGIPGIRRKRWGVLSAVLLLGVLSAGIGCGGGGSSGSTPSGTYTVTVTATDSVTSTVTTSTNFTVTIQ